jgi:predicted dehydrogenase
LDHWYSAFWVLDQIAELDDVKLIGIGERNPQRLEEARQKYSPEIADTNPARILEDERVDLVFSFVPCAQNPAICLESLGRGKHTFCVKPIAMTLEDASSLAAAAQDSGVHFSGFETYQRLTERGRFLKKILKDGIIGDPISCFQVAHSGLPQPWMEQHGDSWWLHPENVPGGAWLDHAIYAIDQLRWTLEREVQTVSGIVDNCRHKHLQLEDWGVAWLRFEDGFSAVMEDTWTADSGTHFTRLIGTEGSLELQSDYFTLHKDGKQERIEIPTDSGTPVSRLVDIIQGEAAAPFKPECSIRNLATCLAVYESARTGRHIRME